MFYTMSAYGLADTKTRDRQIAIMLLFSAVIIVVGSVGTLGHMSQHGLKTLWGFTSNGEEGGCGLGCSGARSTAVLCAKPMLGVLRQCPTHASPPLCLSP